MQISLLNSNRIKLEKNLLINMSKINLESKLHQINKN